MIPYVMSSSTRLLSTVVADVQMVTRCPVETLMRCSIPSIDRSWVMVNGVPVVNVLVADTVSPISLAVRATFCGSVSATKLVEILVKRGNGNGTSRYVARVAACPSVLNKLSVIDDV